MWGSPEKTKLVEELYRYPVASPWSRLNVFKATKPFALSEVATLGARLLSQQGPARCVQALLSGAALMAVAANTVGLAGPWQCGMDLTANVYP